VTWFESDLWAEKISESKKLVRRISLMNSSNLKSMNMKNASTKLPALIFLFTLAIMPLWAQTNVPVASGKLTQKIHFTLVDTE